MFSCEFYEISKNTFFYQREIVSFLQIDKVDDGRHCDTGDLIISICHMTSRLRLCKFIGRSLSQ